MSQWSSEVDLMTYPDRPKTPLWVNYLIVYVVISVMATVAYEALVATNYVAWFGLGYSMIGLLWVIHHHDRKTQDEYQETMAEWSRHPLGDITLPLPPPSPEPPGYFLVRK